MKKVIILAVAILLAVAPAFAAHPIAIGSIKSVSDTTKTKKVKAAKVQYTCTMHPEVLSDKPGKCSKCGMTLVKKETPKKKTAPAKA